MSAKKSLFLIIVLFSTSIDSWAIEDEITFFNVGQGHCTLVHKVGHVPLLVDAGSKQNVRRVLKTQPNMEGSIKGEKVKKNIVSQILNYWNENNTYNGVLNVIVTHGDEDHINYIPDILDRLRLERTNFNFRLLLGGMPEHFRDYDHQLSPYNPYFSSNVRGLQGNGQFVNWAADSGCITHLFCPLGKSTLSSNDLDTKKNTWSIITRIEFDQPNGRLSAILTGDAEESVQQQMLSALGLIRRHEILSDILLYPHHGAKKLDSDWARAVNPQAVVISAGNFKKHYHPRREALSSLFHQYPSGRSLIGQLQTLSLNVPNTNPSERLWNIVDSHRIVYYDEENQFSQNLRGILPTERYQFRTGNSIEMRPYEFSDEPWHITLERGWRCALLNFPIYTTYTSGSMSFKKSPNGLRKFDVLFKDIPTDTEQMAQVIQGNFIDEDRILNRVGGVIDDRNGDYTDLSKLTPTTIQNTFDALQLFINSNLNRSHDAAMIHAYKVFFLSYNIIPHTETNGQKDEIKNYRENNLSRFISYFRDVTININFEEEQERMFFDNVIDLLFEGALSYKNFNPPKKFNDRIRIFDSFVRSRHYNEIERRSDWLYLHSLIYKTLPSHRQLFTPQYLTDIVEYLSTIPFYQSIGEYPVNGLEESLERAKYIYYQCSNSNQYFNANLGEMPEIVRMLHALNLDDINSEIIANFLSWLPNNLNVPVTIATHEIAPYCSDLKRLDMKEFMFLSNKISRILAASSGNNQLDVLKISLINEFRKTH